jgi:hypothetical protein
MAGERASVFDDEDDLDVSGFAPKPATAAPRADPAAIREIASARGFTPRDPAAEPAPVTAPSPPAPPAAERGQVRRRRTNRTAQMNIRTTPEFKALFERLADDERLSLAEAFEAAVEALAEKAARAEG